MIDIVLYPCILFMDSVLKHHYLPFIDLDKQNIIFFERTNRVLLAT